MTASLHGWHQIYDEPVEQGRFVCFDEATARKRLPEFWLRGLEVHVVTRLATSHRHRVRAATGSRAAGLGERLDD